MRRKKWQNVEITFYGKRSLEDSADSDKAGIEPGFIAAGRSEQQNADPRRPCANQGGHAIYGKMLYNGETKFQKEVVYQRYFSVNKPLENGLADWPSGQIPAGTWVGYKFVALNVNDKSEVELFLYRDETGGRNGGVWQIPQVQAVQSAIPATAIDDGSWEGEPPGERQWATGQVIHNCGFSPSTPFTEAGTSIFIRNDGIREAEYKKFTVREIAADPSQYNFESDTQGWTVLPGSMITGVGISSAHSYYGSKSLAVSFGGPYVRKSQVYVRTPTVGIGETIHFHVNCPSPNGLAAISPFLEDRNGAWTDAWTPVSAIALNSWTTNFSITVPPNAKLPLSTLGVEFNSDAAWNGTCYVDSVGWDE
jgi:hypothetical protein